MIPEGFLICDAPPAGYVVVRSPMTAAEVERIKLLWLDAYRATGRSPLAVRFPAPIVNGATGERQWPDAEFCAA